MVYPAKVMACATAEIEFGPGNHSVAGVEGGLGESSIRVLHVPLRARSLLEKKAATGRRHIENGRPPWHGWHVQAWAADEANGLLDDVWNANSHLDGFLDLRGDRRVPVVFDATVQRLAAAALGVRTRWGSAGWQRSGDGVP